MSLQLTFNSYALPSVQAFDVSSDSRVMESIVPRQDGAYSDPLPSLTSKLISIKGIVSKTTAAALETELASMITALSAGLKPLYLYDTKYINCIKKSFRYSYILGTVGKAATYDIQFIATTPFWYGATQQGTEAVTLSTNPQTISITPSGNANSKPVITMTPSGSMTVFTVYNPNNAIRRSMTYTGTVAAATQLILDSDLLTATNSGANCLSTVAGDFIELAGGSANEIQISGTSTAGSIIISYYDTWY